MESYWQALSTGVLKVQIEVWSDLFMKLFILHLQKEELAKQWVFKNLWTRLNHMICLWTAETMIVYMEYGLELIVHPFPRLRMHKFLLVT